MGDIQVMSQIKVTLRSPFIHVCEISFKWSVKIVIWVILQHVSVKAENPVSNHFRLTGFEVGHLLETILMQGSVK